ncbi:hypothetical protein niasHT_000841 [Heterodera trifolii]|uniref:Mannosyltransferase n=1 Tax=Heterodera trifolii TaxID=157864 RepID=A0ABD2MCY8_9BILA
MDWTMSRSAALKILLSVRLSASLWSIISDCDEVFNYWEPLHLVLFGRGFQTWEYAPDYAIRSVCSILCKLCLYRTVCAARALAMPLGRRAFCCSLCCSTDNVRRLCDFFGPLKSAWHSTHSQWHFRLREKLVTQQMFI